MTEPEGRSRKDRLIAGLKLAVVAGALSYLILSGKLELDDLRLAEGRLLLVLAGGGLFLTAMLTSFLRHFLLLRALQVPLRLRDVVRIGFIGCFFNLFMPGGLGGDVIKLAYVMRETGKHTEAVASVMVDRVLGLLGLFTIAGVALGFSWEQVLAHPELHGLSLAIFGVLGSVGMATLVGLVALAKGRGWAAGLWVLLALAAAGFAGVALAGDAVAFSGAAASAAALLRGRAVLVLIGTCVLGLGCVLVVPSCQPGRRLAGWATAHLPLGDRLMQLVQAVLTFRERFPRVLAAYGLSVLLQAIALATLYIYSQALALPVRPSVAQILYAAPPALVANVLPISFGGLGVGETAFQELLALVSAGRVQAGAAIFLLLRFWTVVLSLIGLVLYLRGKREIQEAEAVYREAASEGALANAPANGSEGDSSSSG